MKFLQYAIAIVISGFAGIVAFALLRHSWQYVRNARAKGRGDHQRVSLDASRGRRERGLSFDEWLQKGWRQTPMDEESVHGVVSLYIESNEVPLVKRFDDEPDHITLQRTQVRILRTSKSQSKAEIQSVLEYWESFVTSYDQDEGFRLAYNNRKASAPH